jgi:hypothetical protein
VVSVEDVQLVSEAPDPLLLSSSIGMESAGCEIDVASGGSDKGGHSEAEVTAHRALRRVGDRLSRLWFFALAIVSQMVVEEQETRTPHMIGMGAVDGIVLGNGCSFNQAILHGSQVHNKGPKSRVQKE